MEVKNTYNQSLIKLILPHRLPFLMVDTITGYKGGKNPSMYANCEFSANKILCSVDNTDESLPSVYIIEGLGQCCNLMIVISAMEKKLIEDGLKFNSIEEVLNRLMNDEKDEITRMLKSILKQRLEETYSSLGFVGSVDIEIKGYARQGQLITYETQLNQAFGSLYHSSVKAYAENNLIARGTMVSARRNN